MPPICLTLLIALLVGQQAPPRDAPRAADRLASVSGRVIDRETGQPLRRMRVRLLLHGKVTGAEGMFEAVTDADGRYVIKDLPAGEYSATAGPDEYGAGYETRSCGAAVKPGVFAVSKLIPLAASDERVGIDFALARTYAIEGSVINEYGEALARVAIDGERMDRPGSGFGGFFTTDDRGQFRVYGLYPGPWRVCATAGDRDRARPRSSSPTRGTSSKSR